MHEPEETLTVSAHAFISQGNMTFMASVHGFNVLWRSLPTVSLTADIWCKLSVPSVRQCWSNDLPPCHLDCPPDLVLSHWYLFCFFFSNYLKDFNPDSDNRSLGWMTRLNGLHIRCECLFRCNILCYSQLQSKSWDFHSEWLELLVVNSKDPIPESLFDFSFDISIGLSRGFCKRNTNGWAWSSCFLAVWERPPRDWKLPEKVDSVWLTRIWLDSAINHASTIIIMMINNDGFFFQPVKLKTPKAAQIFNQIFWWAKKNGC